MERGGRRVLDFSIGMHQIRKRRFCLGRGGFEGSSEPRVWGPKNRRVVFGCSKSSKIPPILHCLFPYPTLVILVLTVSVLFETTRRTVFKWILIHRLHSPSLHDNAYFVWYKLCITTMELKDGETQLRENLESVELCFCLETPIESERFIKTFLAHAKFNGSATAVKCILSCGFSLLIVWFWPELLFSYRTDLCHLYKEHSLISLRCVWRSDQLCFNSMILKEEKAKLLLVLIVCDIEFCSDLRIWEVQKYKKNTALPLKRIPKSVLTL